MIDLTKALELCPHCISDKRTLNAVLKDLYPSEKRMIHILTTLYECGIAATMKSKGRLDAIEKSRFSARLENEYAIPEQFSQEGIRIWEAAADNVVKALDSEAGPAPVEPIATIQGDPPQNKPKPAKIIKGNSADFTILHKADGYYIAGFRGIPEKSLIVPNQVDGNEIKGILQDAFRGNNTIEEVNISEGIETIEGSAFCYCQNLKAVYLPRGAYVIGNDAFKGTNLSTIFIPPSVRYIGGHGKNHNNGTKDETLGNQREKLTIFCAEGSAAMEYAVKNGIQWRRVSTFSNAVPPPKTGNIGNPKVKQGTKPPKPNGDSDVQTQTGSKKKYSFYGRPRSPAQLNRIRTDIDEAIGKSCTIKEFENALKQMEYTYKINSWAKYWSVTPKGWNNPIRLYRLGEDYTNDRIRDRIRDNSEKNRG